MTRFGPVFKPAPAPSVAVGLAAPLAEPPTPAVAAGFDEYAEQPELDAQPLSVTPQLRALQPAPASAPRHTFLGTISITRWHVDPRQVRRALNQ